MIVVDLIHEQRQGKYPPPPGQSTILGLEAAGLVHQTGPGATKWKIGDRVMALLPGKCSLIKCGVLGKFTRHNWLPQVETTTHYVEKSSGYIM